MFSSSLRVVLVTLALGALSASARTGLFVKVAAPEVVTDIENLSVEAIITNTGDEPLTLLNDPLSPLSTLPTEVFSITDANNQRPAFTGATAKYVPEVAAASRSYTILVPGQSITVQHDLSRAYNFTGTGAGEYKFETNNHFYRLAEDGSISDLFAEVEATTSRVSGNLGVSRPVKRSLDKRATFFKCSADRQATIASVIAAADSSASNSISYLNAKTSATARYTTWFGSLTTARRNKVVSAFDKINKFDFKAIEYNCECTDNGTTALVYATNPSIIYFCGGFWNAPLTGTDSKAGALIFAASQFNVNGGADRNVVGQAQCKNLAITNPDAAASNGNSYQYFAENNPSLA